MYTLDSETCSFNPIGGLAKGTGRTVYKKGVRQFKDCTRLCNKNKKCKSILYGMYQKWNWCYLKDKVLDDSAPLNDNTKYRNWISFQKTCEKGTNSILFPFQLLEIILKV